MYSFNAVVLLFVVSSPICVIYTQDGNQHQPDQNLVWLGQDDPYVLKLPKLVNVNMSGEVKVVLSNVGQIAQTRESCNGIAVGDLETLQKNMENKLKDTTEEINKTIALEIEDVKNVFKENRGNISSEIAVIKKEISKINAFGDVQSEDKQNMEKLKEQIEDVKDVLIEIKNAIKEIRTNVSAEINEIKKEMLSGIWNITPTPTPMPTSIILGSCKEIYEKGKRVTGVYQIQPKSMPKAFDVFCDMQTRGGGWTVIQNRFDGSQDFDLSWKEYKDGFGDLNKEFWLGLEKIYQMTRNEKNELLLEMAYQDGKPLYARYAEFSIGPENTRYNLTSIQGYSGDAGGALPLHIGKDFSTKDSGRTSSTNIYSGGWWVFYGMTSNLNGKYGHVSESEQFKRPFWYPARQFSPLTKTKILIRPV